MGYGMLPIYASEAGWWAARPLHVLIWAGVFERYPNLSYSMAENGAWWVPDVIRKMDEKWVGGHNTRKFGDTFRQTLRDEAERVPRPQLLLRRVHARASTTSSGAT